MKKIAITLMAALCIAGGAGGLFNSAFAQAAPNIIVRIAGQKTPGQYIGERAGFIDLQGDVCLGDAAVAPLDADEYFFDTKKNCQARKIVLATRFLHFYTKGDKKAYGLPDVQYGANMPVVYDVRLLPKSTEHHNCHRERRTGLWLFRNGNGPWQCIERDGHVEPFIGTPRMEFSI